MEEKSACKFCDRQLPRVKGPDGIWRHLAVNQGLNFRCASQEKGDASGEEKADS